MAQRARAAAWMVLAAVGVAILIALAMPGCSQNQDNSPIRVSNSQGRPSLYVACSTAGSVAYVSDGRNVYRYDRAAGQGQSWQCILSQGERLDMAVQHDPREQPKDKN
jgi:hypothetical protein